MSVTTSSMTTTSGFLIEVHDYDFGLPYVFLPKGHRERRPAVLPPLNEWCGARMPRRFPSVMCCVCLSTLQKNNGTSRCARRSRVSQQHSYSISTCIDCERNHQLQGKTEEGTIQTWELYASGLEYSLNPGLD